MNRAPRHAADDAFVPALAPARRAPLSWGRAGRACAEQVISLQAEDDLLFRALNGDADAATALQERQRARRAARRAAELSTTTTATGSNTATVNGPPKGQAYPASGGPHDGLLAQALRGEPTWLATPCGLRELFVRRTLGGGEQGALLKAATRSEAESARLLSELEQRRATDERLQSDLAQRSAAVDAARAEHEALARRVTVEQQKARTKFK